MWWHRMLSPFLAKGAGSPQEINQSMVGVLTRLLTDTKLGTGRYDAHLDVNLVSWPRPIVGTAGQGALARPGRPAGLLLPDQDRRGGTTPGCSASSPWSS